MEFETLKTRRSSKVKDMTAPAPTGDELKEILTVGARVPDHGKLNPWYFIVFEGDARAQFGQKIREIYHQDHPDATQEQLWHEENRLTAAPLVIAIVSRIRESKIPVWEQLLSAGACCYNICLAANARGYATNWLTQWYAFHPDIRDYLGLENGCDNIAGFIFIGTATAKNEERDRPDINEITTFWQPNAMINKGDIYNKDGLGFAGGVKFSIFTAQNGKTSS